MSATNAIETAVLKHILNGDAIAELSGITTFYISLHTASPGETGSQTTSETSYTGYARQAVSRASGALLVTGNEGTNVSQISFPQCTGGLETITHVGIGTASSGAGTLLLYGALTDSIALQLNMTPVIEAGNLDITCD